MVDGEDIQGTSVEAGWGFSSQAVMMNGYRGKKYIKQITPEATKNTQA